MVMMRNCFVLLFVVLFLSFSSAQGAMTDVDKIVLKLKGMDYMIDPPDPRTVQQIYVSISLQDKSKLLTRVVDETLTRKLWDDIMTDENRKELLKAGLSESKSKELLDVWDKVREKRDFILKKMDEVSENDPKNKEGFDKFMEEYIKKNNVMIDPMFEFEYKDLNRYTLEYKEKSVDSELVKMKYDDGVSLSFPLSDLPAGLKKISAGKDDREKKGIIYSNKYGGKFYVNATDVYPVDYMGKEDEWEVKGFKDFEENEYFVLINFGDDKRGIIYTVGKKNRKNPMEVLAGGFVIEKKASVVIDDKYGIVYDVRIIKNDKSSFIKIYDNGVYLLHGNIVTVFKNGKFNFSEVVIDKSGVVTDIIGRLSYENGFFSDSSGNLNVQLGDYGSKFISLRDDMLSSDGKVVTGNFDKVLARKFTINSDGGIDYELLTADLVVNSGHLIKDNSLILQFGFINAERHIAGASDVVLDLTRVGSSLVDPSGRRGSSNNGKGFVGFFSDAMWIVDRYFSYSIERIIVDGFGFFRR